LSEPSLVLGAIGLGLGSEPAASGLLSDVTERCAIAMEKSPEPSTAPGPPEPRYASWSVRARSGFPPENSKRTTASSWLGSASPQLSQSITHNPPSAVIRRLSAQRSRWQVRSEP